MALSSDGDKKNATIDLKETYANKHGRSKDLVSEKEEIKCNNIITWYKKKSLTLLTFQKKT